ncbi:hypothetical protein OH76DRAFT_376220 [Lentinus brumalis]|uniref:Uncharacterized protein n=1 Tax=Lentinus brumalis TaxID=2498619 RepID=A0A371CIY4_9APHY|nr:hypothetical protein OH76DRAFT_376220 [Polyporus brumalis]
MTCGGSRTCLTADCLRGYIPRSISLSGVPSIRSRSLRFVLHGRSRPCIVGRRTRTNSNDSRVDISYECVSLCGMWCSLVCLDRNGTHMRIHQYGREPDPQCQQFSPFNPLTLPGPRGSFQSLHRMACTNVTTDAIVSILQSRHPCLRSQSHSSHSSNTDRSPGVPFIRRQPLALRVVLRALCTGGSVHGIAQSLPWSRRLDWIADACSLLTDDGTRRRFVPATRPRIWSRSIQSSDTSRTCRRRTRRNLHMDRTLTVHCGEFPEVYQKKHSTVPRCVPAVPAKGGARFRLRCCVQDDARFLSHSATIGKVEFNVYSATASLWSSAAA